MTATRSRICDIIVAVDEPIHAVRCTPGEAIGCRGDRSRCLTHDLWEELSNQIHLYLSSVSLGDVCEKRVLGTSGLAQRETYRSGAASRASLGPTSVASFETPALRAPQDEVSL